MVGVFNDLDLSLVVVELQIESPLSSSRASVFSNTEVLDIIRAMVLGVLVVNTRRLLPSEETLPASWKSWHDAIGAIVYRQWGYWWVVPVAGSARVSRDLSQCRIFARNVRIPASEVLRYDGVGDPCWGRWNPCSKQPNLVRNLTNRPGPPHRLRQHMHNLMSEGGVGQWCVRNSRL